MNRTNPLILSALQLWAYDPDSEVANEYPAIGLFDERHDFPMALTQSGMAVLLTFLNGRNHSLDTFVGIRRSVTIVIVDVTEECVVSATQIRVNIPRNRLAGVFRADLPFAYPNIKTDHTYKVMVRDVSSGQMLGESFFHMYDPLILGKEPHLWYSASKGWVLPQFEYGMYKSVDSEKLGVVSVRFNLESHFKNEPYLVPEVEVRVFKDFSKIYQFANPEQRKFLDLYSRRYEIRVLKEIMTNLFDHKSTDAVDVSPYCDFFRRHSKLDLDRLITCTTMDEFINTLKGNEFYVPLSRIQNHDTALLFDYGMALDLYYFSMIWNVRKKLFSGKDLEQITTAYGEKFDMLNLQFISRSKRYFSMAPADIYALLIPMNYKLKKEEITALVEASTREEAQQIFRKTYYGKKYDHLSAHNLEEFYNYMKTKT